MARIAVGGFQHETNTFAPQQATWEEFVRADAWPPLLRGPEMIAGVEGFNVPIAGAVKCLAELGHDVVPLAWAAAPPDRKSTRLNSSHVRISYAVFCLKKKKKT